MNHAALQGTELLAWIESVAEETAFDCWREARLRWVRRTSRLLMAHLESEAVEEFMRTARATGSSWPGCRATEARAMRDATELLRALASTLST